MGRVIAVTNLKGGIGKTTTVVNVSAGLALKGARVLLVDVDAQGNLSLALGVTPRRTLYEALVDGRHPKDCITSARPNLDLLAANETLLTAQPTISQRADWSRVLEKALHPIKANYDFIFIDCGGSLTVLNINALIAANEVLVPTTVESLSIKGLELLFKQIIRIKNHTGCIRAIVPTMYDSRLRQSGELLEYLQMTYGALVLPPIRINVRLSESTAQGRTIYEHDPRSRGALDYAQLVERLSQIWDFTITNPPQAQNNATKRSTAALYQNDGATSRVATPANDASEPCSAQADSPLVPDPATYAAASHEQNDTATQQPAEEHERPVVTGAGNVLQLTCPHCGHTLQRTMVAGYRVAYCDHCKYKHQELATGVRR
ncbi:MAG: ParA family protein [Chloroflexales bacterium]|nr:ParA family protein [Chloroflexales bacterium]